MEKISRIIPSSPRTRAVEVSGQPVRPGAPALGRPMGRTTPRNFFDQAAESNVANRTDEFMSVPATTSAGVEDKVQFSSLSSDSAKAASESEGAGMYNSKGVKPKSQLVEELAKRFFEGTPKAAAPQETEMSSQVEKIENPVPEL